MSDEDNGIIEPQDDATEEVVNTEEVEEIESADAPETEDESEDEEKIALREQNKKLFERAKKAEAEAKELKTKVKAPAQAEAPSEKQDGLSSMDTIALIGAKVTEKEDIDEVVDYARLKGISVEEALKTNVVKTILKDKAEQRASAEATNTGPARRGSAKMTDEQILDAASKGKEVDPVALAEARWNLKNTN
jgi:hypothetical protein